MTAANIPPAVPVCPVEMSDGRPCGRPLITNQSWDGRMFCLMHLPSPGKDRGDFQVEFERILQAAGGGAADFTGFVFPALRPRTREFTATCIFNQCRFTRRAEFGPGTFAKDVDFSKATFEEGADFTRATFGGIANFIRTRFDQVARFREATFRQAAHFDLAEFSQGADLRGTAFRQQAQFTGSRFGQPTRFISSVFEKQADFSGVTFPQDVEFVQARFADLADFTRARFLGAAQFREVKFRRDGERVPGPIFSLAEFSRPEAVVFYKTYLGQALFHNCDVSRMAFSSVEWRRREPSRKQMVFEEEIELTHHAALALRSKESSDEREYGLIAELYQQLKKNYDDKRDYWTAGDFHFGEMEMKRKHSQSPNPLARWLHTNLGLVAWYKYASKYGESYLRPVGWLALVLLVFTFLFPWPGLDRNAPESQSLASAATPQASRWAAAPQISYRNYSDFVATYQGPRWRARAAFFGHSLMTALSVAGFQKELKYEPSYPWGRAFALLELLATSVLVALFLLAVRRQFRR